jgi:putative solute:sodium symporter small subunit
MASTDYNINLLRPKTPYTKINSIIILTMVAIWAVAVFGFQILLKVNEKPVPEKSYITFTQAWDNVQKQQLTVGESRELVRVLLSVTGKSVTARKNPTLQKLITTLTFNMLPTEVRPAFAALTKELVKNKNLNLKYINAVLGLKDNELQAQVLPYSLISIDQANLTQEEIQSVPGLMRKYLVHNQSVFTDTKFLGFPFHYFYTAVFLLILFVVLCWSYCLIIEKVNTKFGVEKEEG